MILNEEIKALNNHAAFLSNACDDHLKAIKYLQNALLLCNDLERSNPMVERTSTKEKRIHLLSAVSARRHSSLPKMGRLPDEGLTLYTKTLTMEYVTADVNVDHREKRPAAENNALYIIHAMEVILCFNMGVCFALLNNEDQEASLYFDRADAFLSQEFIQRYVSRIILSDDEGAQAPRLDSIVINHNKGLLNFRAEKFTEALDCYNEAMRLALVKDGAQALSVAVALNSIGVLFSHQAHNDENMHSDALQCLISSLSFRTSILGQEALSDKSTATVLNNIGKLKFREGDFEGALKYHGEAYVIRAEVLGEDHLDTGVAAFFIGNCHHSLGRHAVALQSYVEFVRSIFRSKDLEFLTKNVVLALESIANRFQNDHKFEHAGTFFKLTLKAAQKVYGERDEYIAYILNRCGNFHFESSELQEALRLYKQGLEVENVIYPSGHINIATTLSNIARVYENDDNLNQAIGFYERSKDSFLLNTDDKVQDVVTQRITSAFWNIALLQEKSGNLDLALHTHCQSLQFQRRSVCGKDDFQVSLTLNRIGIIRMSKGHITEAVSNFKESLWIRQHLEDCSADSISIAVCNLANAYNVNGDNEQALTCFEEVVHIELSKKENPDQDFEACVLLDVYTKMANILNVHKGDIHKALQYYEKAICICKEEGSEGVPLDTVSQCLGTTGNLYLEVGDVKTAVRLFSETVRINREIGLHDFANIRTFGYELKMMLKACPPSAAAA